MRSLPELTLCSSAQSHDLYDRLIQYISHVPNTIAPERWRDGEDWAGIGLAITDGPSEFNAFATLTERRISFTTGLIGGLWRISSALYILREVHELKSASQDLTQQRLVFDFSDVNTRLAIEELTGAIAAIHSGRSNPSAVYPKLSNEQELGTRQLTLCALGYIACHELGHIKGQHQAIRHDAPDPAKEISRLQESEADTFALDYVLGAVDSSSNKGIQEVAFRSWGAAVATLAFSLKEFERNFTAEHIGGAHIEHFSRRSHPVAYTRLDRLLKHSQVAQVPLVRNTMYSSVAVPLYIYLVHKDAARSRSDETVTDIESLYEDMMNSLHDHLGSVEASASL